MNNINNTWTWINIVRETIRRHMYVIVPNKYIRQTTMNLLHSNIALFIYFIVFIHLTSAGVVRNYVVVKYSPIFIIYI